MLLEHLLVKLLLRLILPIGINCPVKVYKVYKAYKAYRAYRVFKVMD